MTSSLQDAIDELEMRLESFKHEGDWAEFYSLLPEYEAMMRLKSAN